MSEVFSTYFKKWKQGGRQRLVDLLIDESRKNEMERDCVQRTFGAWGTSALSGDKIARKCPQESQEKGHPPKSPDIYAFQDGVQPPLHGD